jgi:hypothetical protein
VVVIYFFVLISILRMLPVGRPEINGGWSFLSLNGSFPIQDYILPDGTFCYFLKILPSQIKFLAMWNSQ